MDDHLMSQLDPIMTEIGEWYDANHRLEESKTLSFQGFIEYNDSDIVFSALSIASIVLFEYETDTPHRLFNQRVRVSMSRHPSL